MITREFKLYLNAGVGVAPVINTNQFDQDEEWIFTLLQSDGTVYTPSTGAIIGLKQDGTTILNAGTVNSAGQVVITETEQITAVPGSNLFEILIDGNTHGTANFVVFVERRPGDIDNPSETDISLFQEAITAAGNVTQFQADISALQSGLSQETQTRQSQDTSLASQIAQEANARSQQDAVLQAEIDQIIAPSGEAPSAAEVQNARIGVDGTTYDTLGNAIRTQVSDLKNALRPFENLLSSIEDYSWENGYVNVNGAIDGTGYDDRKHTTYLICPPETSIVYVAETDHSGVRGISFYDVTKKYISGVSNNGPAGQPQTITSPPGTFYCVLSTKTTLLNASYYLPAVRTLDYVANRVHDNAEAITKIGKKINNGKISADVSPVSLPLTFTGTNPVAIYSDGYHYVTDFKSDDYKNNGGSVLYVAPNAGATGDGTINNPYNYANAYSHAQDGDTIVFLSGLYLRDKHFFSEIKKSINLIGVGTVSIAVGELTTFTAVDGYTDVYIGQRSSGAYVFDISGAPDKVIPLVAVSSVEECAATKGSYYKDSSYYRVHPFTSGNPTGKLLIGVLNTPYEMPLSVSNEDQSANVYFENLNVIGCPSGTRVHKSNDSNDLTVCYNNVKFILCGNGTYNSFNGYGGNYIMHGCSIDGSYRDGFNYNASTVGGAAPRSCNVIEIGCQGHNCGIGQTQETMNGSTSHLGCKVIRVNCEYSDCLGPNVADVQNGTQSVNYGCKSYASRASAAVQCNGFQAAEVGAEMWCFNCIAVGSAVDFNVASSAAMTIDKCAYDSKSDAVLVVDAENVGTWMLRNLI